MTMRRPWLLVFAVLIVAIPLLRPQQASAWKPFTHSYSGFRIFEDLASGAGKVTINGHQYQVRQQVSDAIQAWPSYYNGGVVGPDGFPDIAYGQSIIHPVHTGEWLRYLLEKAWQAQTDSQYSSDQKAQILAFTYGYLTHAAGDMWGHTLINQFAGGVFPGVAEFVAPSKFLIALRHIVAEGYVGTATPGYLQSDTAQCVDVGCTDVSTDLSAAVPIDAPHEFLYNTMIDPNARTPELDYCSTAGVAGCPNGPYQDDSSGYSRGLAIDFFLNLEANLQVKAFLRQDDSDHHDCIVDSTLSPACVVSQETVNIPTVRGTDSVSITRYSCQNASITNICLPNITDTGIIDGLIADYLRHWVADIQDGLKHWTELSLAVARGLFDPQTHRDVQNSMCVTSGPEVVGNAGRDRCEENATTIATIESEAQDYFNNHLLSMLGAPDFVGVARDFISKVGDAINQVFADLGIYNPFATPIELIKRAAEDLALNTVKDAYGIDINAIVAFEKHPSQWMCGTDSNGASLTFPGIGTISAGGVYTPELHAQLDSLMSLPADHHNQQAGIPLDCSPLTDNARFNPDTFAPFKNTVTMGKLLLLDGPELNRALGDLLKDQGVVKDATSVSTYPTTNDAGGAPANVMINALNTNAPFLHLIDGDHAWRSDGLPLFCNPTATATDPTTCSSLPSDMSSYPAPKPRDSDPGLPPSLLGENRDGGSGHFPIWASCLLRPAFRGLFTDWQDSANPTQTNFPNLGDPVQSDPSVPNAPTTSAVLTGHTFSASGKTWVAGDNSFALSRADGVFADGQLSSQKSVFADGGTSNWQSIAGNGSFSIPANGGDGLYHIQYRTQSPCHTFAGDNSISTHDASYYLDTTAPSITVSVPPSGTVYSTDQKVNFQYSLNDGTLGSGVKTQSATFDGSPASQGELLDMFLLAPGVHTLVVNSADNVANSSSLTRTFQIHATPGSLVSNLDRAFSLHLVSNHGVYTTLRSLLNAALSQKNRHDIKGELATYKLLIKTLRLDLGTTVDPATADRLIAYANDLVAHGG